MGEVLVVTTHNPSLYCDESPVTLLNVPQERVEAARARQSQDGCPLFLTLVEEGLILREPGLQLVQHYGQKLFRSSGPSACALCSSSTRCRNMRARFRPRRRKLISGL